MPTDEKLVEEYLSGNEESLHILIERYVKSIYNFVYRYVGLSGTEHDAEDIVQDVFISVWKHIRKFDRTKKFKTWIFAIAKNASLNWLNKKRPRLFSEFSAQGGSASGGENEATDNLFAESIVDTEPLPDKLLERKDIAEGLSTAISKLQPNYREVLLFHYNNDFTFQEISELTGEPLNTVKSRHRRALILLKKMLMP